MSLFGGIAAGVGSLLGGIVSTGGQLYSNAQSLDFSEKAAKNKYQWQVKDMEAAGLNPKLAATQGATSATVPNLGNPGAGIGQGIAQATQLASQYMLAQSAANKNNMEAALAVEQGLTQSSSRNLMQSDAELKVAQTQVAYAQSLLLTAKTAKTEWEREYYQNLANKVLYEANSAFARSVYDVVESRRKTEWLRENADWAIPLQMFGSAAKDVGSIAGNLASIVKGLPLILKGIR